VELDRIYKRDVSNGIRVWWAEIGENELIGHWRVHSGLLNGEIVSSEWRYAPPKSQTTANFQAIFEANAAKQKKLKADYKESINDIDNVRHSQIRPMLAYKYEGWQRPCYAQPKLDGMRAISTPTGLWSRNNRKIISAPHIEGCLDYFFEENPNIVLDGELYNHSLNKDFNMIMSLAKKTKPSFEDLELSEKYLEYWVFDLVDLEQPDKLFHYRWVSLDDLLRGYNEKIILVPTRKIDTEEDLNIHFVECLDQGFEGQIVRHNSKYEEKRSINIQKRKEYIDEEYELIDIEEGAGNWKGLAKRAICILPDGRTFGAGISGTQQYCEKLLLDKDQYKSVTIKYFALTPDGIPRFPIATKFFDQEFGGLEERLKVKRDLFT
jgi:DNA ligase 1